MKMIKFDLKVVKIQLYKVELNSDSHREVRLI